MAILEIELLGSEVLRQKAEVVTDLDDDLRELVRNMFKTMYQAEGIGLAGPQVGISKRIVVLDVPANEEDRHICALINPVIVESSELTEKAPEGCLSIPGMEESVVRPTEVVVEALDPDGEPVRIQANGLLARALQHEIDHLNGVLFIDYLSPLKRSMALKKWRKEMADNERSS